MYLIELHVKCRCNLQVECLFRMLQEGPKCLHRVRLFQRDTFGLPIHPSSVQILVIIKLQKRPYIAISANLCSILKVSNISLHHCWQLIFFIMIPLLLFLCEKEWQLTQWRTCTHIHPCVHYTDGKTLTETRNKFKISTNSI